MSKFSLQFRKMRSIHKIRWPVKWRYLNNLNSTNTFPPFCLLIFHTVQWPNCFSRTNQHPRHHHLCSYRPRMAWWCPYRSAISHPEVMFSISIQRSVISRQYPIVITCIWQCGRGSKVVDLLNGRWFDRIPSPLPFRRDWKMNKTWAAPQSHSDRAVPG